ncbi:MAG: hypothetical protein JNJ77_14450 [Planctomycetia bacterium]|nr:hypothetical protein [Planctomycetia bacterium]
MSAIKAYKQYIQSKYHCDAWYFDSKDIHSLIVIHMFTLSNHPFSKACYIIDAQGICSDGFFTILESSDVKDFHDAASRMITGELLQSKIDKFNKRFENETFNGTITTSVENIIREYNLAIGLRKYPLKPSAPDNQVIT